MRAIDGLHLSLKLSGSLTDNKEAWEGGLTGREEGRCRFFGRRCRCSNARRRIDIFKEDVAFPQPPAPALPPARHADEDDGGGNLNTLSRFNASGRSHTSNNAWAGAGAGGNLNLDPRQSGILVQRSPIAIGLFIGGASFLTRILLSSALSSSCPVGVSAPREEYKRTFLKMREDTRHAHVADLPPLRAGQRRSCLLIRYFSSFLVPFPVI